MGYLKTLTVPLLALAAAGANAAGQEVVEKIDHGVIVRPADAAAADVKIEAVAPGILRVMADPDGDFARTPSLMRAKTGAPPAVKVGEAGGQVTVNQLAQWQRMGYLDGLPEPAAVPRVAGWQDPMASLDARARAYLDINCAHCHSAVGPGNTSGLWLASDVSDPLRLGRCKLPIAAGHGTGNHRFGIVPGKPDESILTYRMVSNDPGVMMPELGRSVAHAEGVALIRAWIAAQAGECGDTG